MGKGRPRAVEKGVLGQNLNVSSSAILNIPSGPVYYPTEDEFRDPLEYVYKIRPEAEPYGICRIVPPKGWKPPFALNLDSFTFPTKTQAIHQLQARPAACDSETFELEYNRFLEDHCSKKLKKKVVFEGDELDLCKLFNAVKRYGGYEKVVGEKKWGKVYRFVGSARKIPECAKHVLCQLYREHLYDYENYNSQLNKEVNNRKRGKKEQTKSECMVEISSCKRRRTNNDDRIKLFKIKESEEHDQVCEQCKSGLHGEVMLLCDRCDKGWHIYCLSPPLKHVPLGNWYCFDCLNSDKDSFGFVPGKCLSLEAFRRVAERTKKKWFGSGSASRMQIEKKFWEIVEGSVGEVEVMYGSDLDTSVFGSGFPRENDQKPESIDAEVWDEYCGSPWNLNNLPKLNGSVLRAVHNNITGVMVPWLYIGMLFSSFCWHFEDHCFYSINYLHWGEPKCWYSVPGSEAQAFEKVMRNSLPDLFDAQPDLLFQLVTMLNPSVLQENGVPVYSILQEPGNFVITFPRSYHGGFNLGLNCAEAVNFAPADWIPHGGFGAELYQRYHKIAVLSHEELLCVIAKNDCNDRVSPYLKKELIRICIKEKGLREQLWKNGIVRSSSMSARKCAEHVGSEEDPKCIICQQYLHLSAVVCRCRKSAFVCLEHWRHLCECRYSKRRLLYRHTLAELYDLVHTVDKHVSLETAHNMNMRRQISFINASNTLTRKVKGLQTSFHQLAERWLLHSSKIRQNPFSSDAYVKALKEAEQFLWAGSEMDPVRDLVRKLIEARKWAEGINHCISKIEKWSCCRDDGVEKIHLDYVNDVLSLDPIQSDEPAYFKLKEYAEEAKSLTQEIDTALSTCSHVSEWEILYARACALPIHTKETEKLSQHISLVKVCVHIQAISGNQPATIDFKALDKLKMEISELRVQLPETRTISDLIMQAESCRSRCTAILEGPSSLKNVEVLLLEFGSFPVSVPELELLRQCYNDAVSLISRFNHVLENIHERKDQQNVVDELKCILRDGSSLKIQVEELPLVEVELKKACCREKAHKARNTKSSTLDSFQQLITEAVILHIDGEKLFADMSGILDTATTWEDRATYFLANGAQMSDFEEMIRTAEDIHVILPSLDDVKSAVSMAKSWLKISKPLLESCFSVVSDPSSLLKVEKLKELVSQSELLKVSLEERRVLETVMKKCEEWKDDASSVLHDADCLFNVSTIGDGISDGLIFKIEDLVTKMDSVMKAGSSLGFDFCETSKLQKVRSALNWCSSTLSFCSVAPCYEDVESLVRTAEVIPGTCASGTLLSSLMDAVKWLKRAVEVISLSCNSKSCKLSDAEEVLADSQSIKVKFYGIVHQVENAIQKHKLWEEQVHKFFSIKSSERSWSAILKLKELGNAVAFKCSELELILSEVEKVEKWKQRCAEIVGILAGEGNSLLGVLQEIKQTLNRSLDKYDMSMVCKDGNLCEFCSRPSRDREFLTCSVCKEGYHLQCLGSAALSTSHADMITCQYCQCIVEISVDQNGGRLKFGSNRPGLENLIQLQSDAEDLCVWIEEVDTLKQLVEQALVCKSRLKEVVDFVSCHTSKDLNIVLERLNIALKALEVTGVNDNEGICSLEKTLVRNSWRFRTDKKLGDSQRPTMRQIGLLLEEGLALNIPPDDYYRQKLTEIKNVCLQWAARAKKIAADSGALELNKVFEVITEGENLPAHVEELKLLRNRSMLYCICRKPYDKRAMIACDQCDEWYHFDCIKLRSTPKTYICPACNPNEEMFTMPDYESSITMKFVEPKTPSPRHSTKSRSKLKKVRNSSTQKMVEVTDCANVVRSSDGIERLWWRNRKPFRRAARKRSELESLSPFFHLPQ